MKEKEKPMNRINNCKFLCKIPAFTNIRELTQERNSWNIFYMGSLSSKVQSSLWIRELTQQRNYKDNEHEKYSYSILRKLTLQKRSGNVIKM